MSGEPMIEGTFQQGSGKSGGRQYPTKKEMGKQQDFRQGLEAKVQMAEKIKELEGKTGHEVTEEEFMELLEKVQHIQDKDEKTKKNRKTKKNSIEEDFSKGAVRNQPCPLCHKKLKKCLCGFLL
jgi:hypothetical protein